VEDHLCRDAVLVELAKPLLDVIATRGNDQGAVGLPGRRQQARRNPSGSNLRGSSKTIEVVQVTALTVFSQLS
jgi:hypothetical protein